MASTAWDGKKFPDDVSDSSRADFEAVYGDNAADAWVNEHNNDLKSKGWSGPGQPPGKSSGGGGGKSGSGGSGGGGGGGNATGSSDASMINPDAVNAAASLAAQKAQQAYLDEKLRQLEIPQFKFQSEMAKKNYELELDKFAFTKAQEAFDEEIKKAGLTGYYNGLPTLERTIAEAEQTGMWNGSPTFKRAVEEAGLTGFYNGLPTWQRMEGEAGLTGYYNGQSTLARESEENQTALGLMNLVSNLHGPRRVMDYLRTLAGTPQGLRDAVGALMGRFDMPGFGGGATDVPIEGMSLQGLLDDIMTQGSTAGGAAPAVPGTPGGGFIPPGTTPPTIPHTPGYVTPPPSPVQKTPMTWEQYQAIGHGVTPGGPGGPGGPPPIPIKPNPGTRPTIGGLTSPLTGYEGLNDDGTITYPLGYNGAPLTDPALLQHNPNGPVMPWEPGYAAYVQSQINGTPYVPPTGAQGTPSAAGTPNAGAPAVRSVGSGVTPNAGVPVGSYPASRPAGSNLIIDRNLGIPISGTPGVAPNPGTPAPGTYLTGYEGLNDDGTVTYPLGYTGAPIQDVRLLYDNPNTPQQPYEDDATYAARVARGNAVLAEYGQGPLATGATGAPVVSGPVPPDWWTRVGVDQATWQGMSPQERQAMKAAWNARHAAASTPQPTIAPATGQQYTVLGQQYLESMAPYRYSPPGAAAPSDEYNYSPQQDGTYTVSTPGNAAPPDAHQFSSSTPLSPAQVQAASQGLGDSYGGYVPDLSLYPDNFFSAPTAQGVGPGLGAPPAASGIVTPGNTGASNVVSPGVIRNPNLPVGNRLPRGNRFNARDWYNLPQYTKDALMSVYEAAGHDPTVIQEEFLKSLPRFGGPAAGHVVGVA